MINLVLRSPWEKSPILFHADSADSWDVNNALLEVLYIWHELTPCDRRPKFSALDSDGVMFDYHGLEPVLVKRTGEHEFTIEVLE